MSLPIDFIDTNAEINGVNQTMTGLHPYTLYSLRIRMRSKKSNEDVMGHVVNENIPEMSDKLW